MSQTKPSLAIAPTAAAPLAAPAADAGSPARRSRTYSYAVPVRDPARWKGASGLEAMQRLIRGESAAPPIADTLAFALVEVEPGHAIFEGDPAEWMENPLGTIHGGWISTLLDSSLGCAVHSTLAPGMTYTSATLEVKFVRAILPTTGRVRAEARVIHAGSRLAVVESKLTGIADGKVYATATSTCMIFELR
jgi:uncharacterized protein (TIGR00369 family)